MLYRVLTKLKLSKGESFQVYVVQADSERQIRKNFKESFSSHKIVKIDNTGGNCIVVATL